ncbi:MAG: FGGY-family carbohydrate kinase, partial [Candidatus Bipolaricaulia bacterium]
AGAGDQAAGALGAGIVQPGVAFDVAGTASVFSACVDNFRPDIDNRVVLAAPSLVEGQYYALAFINGGGMNLRWFRDELSGEVGGDTDVYKVLDKKAKERNPGSSRLFFLPHVQGRVCPPEPYLRGLWLGFTWGHDKPSFYRSILEGIAYEYAYYLDIERNLHPSLDFSEVRAIGGGSASDFWNQIKADVLGIPYRTIDREEVGILGDAILAGAAVGLYDDLAETGRSLVNPVDLLEPRDEYNEFYRPYVDFYQRLLEQAGEIFEELADLPSNLDD